MDIKIEFDYVMDALLQQITKLSKDNALLRAECIALKKMIEENASENKQ